MRPTIDWPEDLLVAQWKAALAPERLEYRTGRGWVPRASLVGTTAGAAARSQWIVAALSALSFVTLGGWALSRLSMSRKRQTVAAGSLNLRIVRGRKAA